jgi:cyclopropane-fatty-acyl-phospholipid synthase
MHTIHKESLFNQIFNVLRLFLKEGKPLSYYIVMRHLRRLKRGRIAITLPDQSHIEIKGEESSEERAALDIKDWNVFRRVLLKGEVGFAESYVAEEWTSPDLVGLMKILISNQKAFQENQEPLFVVKWFFKIQNWLFKNTIRQSVSNVHAHYDLGNNFYRLWLDPSMTYSCALFEGKKRTLEEAQQAKYNRILEHLSPKEGDKILDIGCGWGGFAEIAAERHVEVNGVTLSEEQLSYAKIRAKNFPYKVMFQKKDYRELKGRFDFVVSIGMLEHVGKSYWNRYFKKINQLLKPGGKAMIQSIVYMGDDFESYAKSFSFIRLYIFPGGLLPTPDHIKESAERAGLKVIDRFDFGLDYAKTLSIWRRNFLKALPEIYKLGFDGKFKRLWLYYLCSSEAAFLARDTSVMQFEFVKSN